VLKRELKMRQAPRHKIIAWSQVEAPVFLALTKPFIARSGLSALQRFPQMGKKRVEKK
jgi:hypothetical protein